MAWIEPPSVSKTKAVHCWDVEMETTVVIVGRADIVAIGGMRSTQCVYSWVVVKCLCSSWCKCCLFKIERSIEFVIGGNVGIALGEPHEIERQFHLG